MIRTEDIWEAYLKCLKNKRNTPDGVAFVLDSPMAEIVKIKRQIERREYVPYPSKCFIITRPRYREAFAANFRDRIVQDWVMIRLEPLFEAVYSERTFNCRKGKGQLYGIQLFQDDIRRCSEDFTKEAWIMKLDLSAYFMSIDKETLARDIITFTRENYNGDDMEELCYVIGVIIRHNPQNNCMKRSKPEMWKHIPPHKSLFTCGKGKGLPIGNLTSQHAGNFRLYRLDWLLGKLVTFHGRYVDDIYLVDKDPERLKRAVPEIRAWLDIYGLKLNEKKTYLQPWEHGVEFTGARIRGGMLLPGKNAIYSFIRAVKLLGRQTDPAGVEKVRRSLASYSGNLSHFKAVKLIRRTFKHFNLTAA